MKTEILLDIEGYALIDVSYTGDPEGDFDTIFVCSHGFHDENFLEAFPHLKKAYAHIPVKILHQYLRLEYDFAARSLAHAIANHTAGHLKTAIIRIHYHRGIVDANRMVDYAVRNIFDRQRYPEVEAFLRMISRETERVILDFLAKRLSQTSGFVFDVHTMWPTNQHIHPSDFEIHDRVEKYVEALINPENQAQTRSINMIAHNEQQKPIADLFRAEVIANSLQKSGFPVQIDKPYMMSAHHRGRLYASLHPGVAYDVPRFFLGKQGSADPSIWLEDSQKIDRVALAFAEGIIEAQSRHFQDSFGGL